MATLLWQRDLADDAYGVKNTFSSWDSCMAQTYCKWPAIIGIVVGSLIVLSIVFCCARCLCCGLECCCGICSCFNRCCPSPRGGRRNSGYEKPYQPYNNYNSHTQYQSPSPMYFGGGYREPQTATFDTPSNKNVHADSLPAMPTWSTAQSRKVEDDSVELEKMDATAQQQRLLNHQRNESDDSTYGDLGAMPASPYEEKPNQFHAQTTNAYQTQRQPQAQPDAYRSQHTAYPDQPSTYQAQPNAYQPQYNAYTEATSYGAQPNTQYSQPASYDQMNPYQEQAPYHSYEQHQQFAGSPTSTAAPSMYPPTYHTRPPSSVYTSPYGAAPPYQTAPPSIASPPQQHAQMNYGGMGRKPAPGARRDF